MTRCSMTGRLRAPSASTKFRSKRSGRVKSHCMVAHCHSRFKASVSLMSILGAVEGAVALVYLVFPAAGLQGVGEGLGGSFPSPSSLPMDFSGRVDSSSL